MNNIRVTILTSENCSFCDQAKSLFERLSKEYPIIVEVLDLSTREGEEAALKTGALFPSSVLIDNRLFCYGRPSEAIIRKELNRRT